MKEQEFLVDEFEKNYKLMVEKEKELAAAQADFEKAKEALHSCDFYAAKIARNLGEGSQATTEHVKLLEEIAALQREQEQVTEDVKSAKFWVNPIEQERLVREAAAIVLDIDQETRDLEDLEESIFKHQMSTVEKGASEEYAVAMSCDMEARVAQQCRNHLKQQLAQLRNSMNEAPSGESGKRTSAANEIAKTNDPVTELLAEKTDLLLELEEARLKKKLAEMHKKAAIKSTFRMVTNLNAILARLDQETVDLEEIKRVCGLEALDAEDKKPPPSRPRTAVSKRKQISTPRIHKQRKKEA